MLIDFEGLSTVTNFTVETESVWSLLLNFNGVLRGQITQKIASIYQKIMICINIYIFT